MLQAMTWQEFIEDKTSFHFSIIICGIVNAYVFHVRIAFLGLPFHVIVIGIINAYVFSCGNNDDI
jgi:hypothetical protein